MERIEHRRCPKNQQDSIALVSQKLLGAFEGLASSLAKHSVFTNQPKITTKVKKTELRYTHLKPRDPKHQRPFALRMYQPRPFGGPFFVVDGGRCGSEKLLICYPTGFVLFG